jgi:acetyltransferase
VLAQLPAGAALASVLDLTERAGPDDYRAAVGACAADPSIDAVLAIYAPMAGGDPLAVARALADLRGDAARPALAKPLLTCWMGGEAVRPARRLLGDANVATFRTPEAAVDSFGNIAAFYQNRQLLRQTPPPLSALAEPDVAGARMLIENVLAERRCVLTELESKALLAAFHIPVTQTVLARSANEAILIASQIGYPVALKIDSPDIAHKSDVRGVALHVQGAAAVRDVYHDMIAGVGALLPNARINGVTIQRMSGKRHGRELYIGVVTDPVFGPVIAFGAGGTMIELIDDRAVELPPLNQFLARGLVARARAAATLGAWRGAPPARLEAIEHILLRVSEMVCALPQLREMDINPLIVDDAGALVVDARVVLAPATPQAEPYAHLAILPYPADCTEDWPMAGGGQVTLRPIRPDDASMLQAFMRGLSDDARYMRFASTAREHSEAMLARYTLIDYDREMALVAVTRERTPTADGSFEATEHIIGVARYVTNPDLVSCEFSLVVGDAFGGRGLGSRLMHAITDQARRKGLKQIDGLVLSRNAPMLKLMRTLGFTVHAYPDDPDFKLCSKAL